MLKNANDQIIEVIPVDETGQLIYIDEDGAAKLYPSKKSPIPHLEGLGKEAICYYHPIRHPAFFDDDAELRGYRPYGTLTIRQKSPFHFAELTWDIKGLRENCWTEGHVHYAGDRHEHVFETFPEIENVHLN